MAAQEQAITINAKKAKIDKNQAESADCVVTWMIK